MRVIVWLFRAFVFFTLFAFALNNQQTASVHWFFGVQWQAPMVIVVLTAFAAGSAIGVVAMVPSWWRHRRQALRQSSLAAPAAQAAPPVNTQPPSEFGPDQIPRVGL
jgi:lipopolysaccharide assembly protein A